MPYFNWNDHKLFYRKQGKGPLLLILPGDTASSICHQADMDYFSSRYCTVSLDFLGTGQSERVNRWATNWWEQNARQAQSLIEHLGYSDCIVMGTSGGAVAGLLLAALYPSNVRAVIADSIVEQISKKTALEIIVEDRRKRTLEQKQFWEYAHGTDWEKVVEADTDMLLRFVDNGGDWFCGRLEEVCCPVLITASKMDPTFPNIAENVSRMSEKIADCRLFLNNKGDHPMMWTAPQVFRAISDYFLGKVVHSRE